MSVVNFSDIPIIGKTREWKELSFEFMPIAKAPVVDVPGAKPEIVGYQFVFKGMRSDGIPCQVVHVIEKAKVVDDPILTAFQFVRNGLTHLESYRTCACLPNQPCPLHAARLPGKAS